MNLGKTSGHHGITPEMAKYMEKAGIGLLVRIMKIDWGFKKIS